MKALPKKARNAADDLRTPGCTRISMAKPDPYITLGVSKTATPEEIKRAYRRLARECHPDVNHNSAASHAQFREVAEAYEILSDAGKRRRYDRFGHAGLDIGFERYGSQGTGSRYGTRGFDASGFRFGFRRPRGGGFESFEDIFSDLFGSTRARTMRRNAPSRGSDLEYDLTLDFDQAYHGILITVRVLNSSIEVSIPAGVHDGSRVRVVGRGAPGLRGGPPGDLYLNVTVTPHDFLRREGNDVFATLPITFGEAVLGAKVELPGPSGALILSIPAGTQSGTAFRFRNLGFKDPRERTRGDFFVTVQIVVPENIDEVSRDLVMDFERRNSFRPRSGL